MIDLAGQVVLVTGAGRGLGESYARLLAARGAHVAVHDAGVDRDGSGNDPAPAHAVAGEITDAGRRASVHMQNLATRHGCEELIAEVLAEHGRIDALVHNAGIVRYHGISEATADEYDTTMAINAHAAWWLCSAVWPLMRTQRYGRIVLTTSDFGLRTIDGADVAAYSVSKASQFGLMNALAGEGRSHGILVNAICPVAATRIFRRTVQPQELMPASVAPGVAVLVSRKCPFTGHVLRAAGGEWRVYQVTAVRQADLGRDASPEDVLEWATHPAG
ncbi:SDR family NAD(P)-dependent oxidoreductase [Micromonospora ureilytica]|uniref:SDR family NAD(P)-dependent oxidoreductase n=1 Tax=Micromonospora ureilytica TaxID=709868 RepID=UPI001F0B9E86|nr:SDR family NAD(P)-dependent oxidoreductase [Micromonospora ureilytica]